MASVVTHAFRPFRQRRIWVFTAVTALAAAAALVASPASRASAAAALLSQGQPATASSVQSASYPASAAVDGNTGTRWSSAFSDPQWLQVDLGSSASITQVVLQWEAAYATAFQIQTSTDGTNWTTIYSTTTGTGGTQTLNVTGSGRYIRMYGTARATQYGYSLWEFQVYGSLAGGTCGTANAALNQPATASSTENAGFPASAAVDGNTGTRWSSAFSDPQWLQVDLGSSKNICQVTLDWETAYATAFQIQTSNDGTNWTSIYSTTTGTGGTQTLNVTGSGRYIRMYGTVRATQYGYSLWEFGVYTTSGGGGNTVTVTNPGSQTSTVGTAASLQITATDSAPGQTLTYSATGLPAGLSISPSSGLISGTPTTAGSSSVTVTAKDTTSASGSASFGWTVTTTATCPAQSNTPNLGPNVDIFDPSMSSSSIQSTLDSVFNTQKLNQFGTQRYALLFKPGTYSVEANIGYYTSIAAWARTPTTSPSMATSPWTPSTARATPRRTSGGPPRTWRSTRPPGRTAGRWRRRARSAGWTCTAGWNCTRPVTATPAVATSPTPRSPARSPRCPQQQWYSRDSNFGSWSGSVWNMVFSGVNGAPAQSFPSPPMTTLATTPVSRDVPYLYIDSSGNYHVFEPSLRTNASGASWANGPTPGTSVPMSQFFVADPSMSAATINTALSEGLQPALHPRRLQPQPDAQRHPCRHHDSRHRVPDPDPAKRRQHHAGVGCQRGPDQGPAVRRRHDQLAGPADRRHGRLDGQSRERPDLGPGRVLPDRRRHRRQGHGQPGRERQRHHRG